jgi:hypothetical protein
VRLKSWLEDRPYLKKKRGVGLASEYKIFAGFFLVSSTFKAANYWDVKAGLAATAVGPKT